MAEEEVEKGMQDLLSDPKEEVPGKTKAQELEEAQAKASSSVSKAFEDMGINLDEPVEGDEKSLQDGVKEGQKDAASLKKKTPGKDAENNKWQNAKDFGKWVGTELGNGALFQLGTQLVSAAWAAATKDDPNSASDGTDQLATLATLSSNSATTLGNIMQEWHKWLLNNYTARHTFGSVSVEGTAILRYEIFQVKISNCDDYQNGEMVKAAAAAKDTTSQDTLMTLLGTELRMGMLMADVANDITSQETKMVQAGLLDHTNDINTVISNLQTNSVTAASPPSSDAGSSTDSDSDSDT